MSSENQITAREFGEGLYSAVLHANENFIRDYWHDFEKRFHFQLPSECKVANFKNEALILNYWIAAKTLGTRHKESFDQLTILIVKSLLEEEVEGDPNLFVEARFKEYYKLIDKENFQELGFILCENLYNINMVDWSLLTSDPLPALKVPLLWRGYIKSMMDTFLTIENSFQIKQ